MESAQVEALQGELKTAWKIAEHNAVCYKELEAKLQVRDKEILALRRMLHTPGYAWVPLKMTPEMQQAWFVEAGSPSDAYDYQGPWEAALKVAPTPNYPLYAHVAKGGVYKDEGVSMGASSRRNETLQIYRDVSTGQLYHRDPDNFTENLVLIEQEDTDNA